MLKKERLYRIEGLLRQRRFLTIAELEQELGVTLFIRGKRRTTLTSEGVFLRRQAEQLLSLAEKTKQDHRRSPGS